MRVICIDEGVRKCTNSNRIASKLIEGGVYTVVETRKSPNGSYYVYILEELEPDIGYETNLFVPISEIDETTFERNYSTIHA